MPKYNCMHLSWMIISVIPVISVWFACTYTGVILSSVLRNADGRSPFLLVLDAGTFKEVARVEFDGVDMHKDIHGLFTPFSSPHSCWLVSPQSWFTGQFEILTWLNTLLDVLPLFVYACIFFYSKSKMATKCLCLPMCIKLCINSPLGQPKSMEFAIQKKLMILVERWLKWLLPPSHAWTIQMMLSEWAWNK